MLYPRRQGWGFLESPENSDILDVTEFSVKNCVATSNTGNSLKFCSSHDIPFFRLESEIAKDASSLNIFKPVL